MIKKIIYSMIILVLFSGCNIAIEEPDDIIISCTPSSSIVTVSATGEVKEFSYSLILESGNVNINLDTITIQYYSDIDLINSRKVNGNFLTLTKENSTKIFPLNIVVPEIMTELEKSKAVKAVVTLHFTSISGVEKELNSEISIIKKVAEE